MYGYMWHNESIIISLRDISMATHSYTYIYSYVFENWYP
jgi:hypothetical protein